MPSAGTSDQGGAGEGGLSVELRTTRSTGARKPATPHAAMSAPAGPGIAPPAYAGLTAASSVVAVVPQRAHVQATWAGSSLITTGHSQVCGGQCWRPSATHQIAYAIAHSDAGLSSGPAPSVTSVITRA